MKIEDIRHIEFELSSRCNAACPQCPRQSAEFQAALDTKEEITLKNVKDWLPQTVLDKLEKISFKGTFSEPAIAKDCLDIVQHLADNSNAKIMFHTNGSLRDKDFWQKLAVAIDHRGRCVFAIDGLEDTHAIYRINTNYHKIINNAATYIAAGGAATWQFIAFQHNQHQIDQAKDLSKSMGFMNFRLMGSNRFDTEFDLVDTNKGNRITKSDLISSPTLEDYNDRIKSTRCVDCISEKTGWIMIDWSGDVFPCCYSQVWKSNMHTHSLDSQYWYKRILRDPLGNNLHHRSLQQISEKLSELYTQLNGSMIPKICAKHCSII